MLNLRTLFRVVAVIEALYAALGLFTPPRMVGAITGWVLTPDGQWLAKLMGAALASQAWVAWIFRDAPDRRVALALAFYQLVSATVDATMWLTLADDGIFSTAAAKVGVAASIALHSTIGCLILLAVRLEEPALTTER